MNAVTKVVGFALGLAAVFGLALLAGNQVGPLGETSQAASGHSGADDSGDHGGGSSTHQEEPEVPGGLMVSTAGYTLALQDTSVRAGRGRPVSFVIEGPEGPVTEFETEHEKPLHLIAVRRDFEGYQHVHPSLAPDGTWTADLDLSPGQWRVFADFRAAGSDPVTLGADLSVPGKVTVEPDSGPSRVATVDGYTVRLDGDLAAGEDSPVELSVTRDGTPVTDLQPYLGAYGHLVALRGGDLAYLHVHPEEEAGDQGTTAGPSVRFVAEVPSTGRYHLYLDFKHDGVVRTATFTLDAEKAGHTP